MEDILSHLLSANNQERQDAEVRYELLKKDNVVALLSSMLQIMCMSNHAAAIRSMAAVLVRRLLIDDDGVDEQYTYRKMSETDQTTLRMQLINAIKSEKEPYILARVIDIVGELCVSVLEANEWPEIMPYIKHCLQGSDTQEVETGMLLVGLIAPAYVNVFLDNEHFGPLLSALCVNIRDPSRGFRTMLAALKALASLVSLISRPSVQDKFLPISIPCLEGLQAVCSEAQKILHQNNDEENQTVSLAATFVETVIDMLDSGCFLFEAELLRTFETIMALIESEQSQGNFTNVSQQLVELLVTICEINPRQCRKLKGNSATTQKNYFGARFLPVCARLMTKIEDDTNWETDTEIEESHENSIFDTGEQAFDRSTQSLGLRSTFSIVLNILKDLLSDSLGNWKLRYAGIRIICNYVDVTTRIPEQGQLEQHRHDISATLLAYAADIHPRVRAAAYYGLANFMSCHGESINEEIIDRIIQVLLSSLSVGSNPSPRVRREVLMALVAALSILHAKGIERWAGLLLGYVSTSMQDGPVIVQEQCISVIFALAESTHGDVLAKYYSSLMPVMQNMLLFAQEKQLDSLWGTTLVCCAMIGEASGVEVFRNDAEAIMNLLVTLQNRTDAASDVNRYLLQAWVYIARCLEHEFAPYLGPVMMRILQTIEHNAKECEQELSEENFEEMENRSDMDVIEGTKGLVAYRTSSVEELACACQLIKLVAEKMQGLFYPFVEQTTRILTPLVQSPHDDVRCFAIMSMAELVTVTVKNNTAGEQVVVQISTYIVGILVEFLHAEVVLEIIIAGLRAVNTVVRQSSLSSQMNRFEKNSSFDEHSCKPIFSTGQLNSLSQCVQSMLRDSIQRRAVQRAESAVTRTDNNNDDEAADNNDDDEVFVKERKELHSCIAELIKTLIMTHRQVFTVIYFDEWNSMLTPMMHEFCLAEDQEFAIDIISCFIRYGITSRGSLVIASDDSARLQKFLSDCIPRICQCLQTDSSIRTYYDCCSTLCTGMELYPTEISTYVPNIINALTSCISRNEHTNICTDRAAMTLGVAFEVFDSTLGSTIDLQAEIPKWLSQFPLRHDEASCYQSTMQFVRYLQRHTHTGNIAEHIPEMLCILLDIVDTNLCNGLLSGEIYAAICKMYGSTSVRNANDVEMLYHRLKTKQRIAKFEHILGTESVGKVSVGSAKVFSASPGMTAPIHDVLLGKM